MNVKITALPQICADIYEGEKRIYPGGEALNFAVHCSEFTGIDITLLGVVGNDEYGHRIMDIISCKRIDSTDVRIDKKLPTAFNRTYLSPDGDRYYKDDSWHGEILDSFKLGKKDKNALMISDVVFMTRGCACYDEVISLRDEYGFKLAVDFDVTRDLDDIAAQSSHIDFIFLSGSEELIPGLRELAAGSDSMFNMTMADHGSITFFKGEEYRAEAVPPDETVDSTGCGDSYHAAFICTYMKEHDIDKAMKNASELASITLEHLGGF